MSTPCDKRSRLASDLEEGRIILCDPSGEIEEPMDVREMVVLALRSARKPTVAEIAGAVARGWCSPLNSHKEMDGELAFAISVQVAALVGVSDGGTANGA